MQAAGSPQDTPVLDQMMPPAPLAQKCDHDSDALQHTKARGLMRVCDLAVEHVDESPCDTLECADIAVPSADEPAEFLALDETELGITAMEEALDRPCTKSWSKAHHDSLRMSMALASC